MTVQHFNDSCKRAVDIRPDTSFVLHTMTSGQGGSPYGTPKRKEAAAMQRQIMTFRISELEADRLQAQADALGVTRSAYIRLRLANKPMSYMERIIERL